MRGGRNLKKGEIIWKIKWWNRKSWEVSFYMWVQTLWISSECKTLDDSVSAKLCGALVQS